MDEKSDGIVKKIFLRKDGKIRAGWRLVIFLGILRVKHGEEFSIGLSTEEKDTGNAKFHPEIGERPKRCGIFVVRVRKGVGVLNAVDATDQNFKEYSSPAF